MMLPIDPFLIPESERLLLAQQLVDTLVRANDLTPDQLAELYRRADDVETGVASCEPWDTVYPRLRGLIR